MKALDTELLTGCIDGDRLCQHRLYKKLHGFMLAIAFKYTHDRDTALDYANSGFYKIIRKIHMYDFKTPFDAWARVIVKHTIIDEMRKGLKHRHLAKLENTDLVVEDGIDLASFEYTYKLNITYTEENSAIQKLELESLLKRLEVLPPVTRKVVVMQVLEGFTHKEISKELGIGESASKWHLAKGKSLLKEEFRSAD